MQWPFAGILKINCISIAGKLNFSFFVVLLPLAIGFPDADKI